MLQMNPAARPSLADIIGHPWMQGTVADSKLVHAEFTKRHQMIKQQQNQEAAEKAAKRQTHANRKEVRRGENLNGVVYMSASDDTMEESKNENVVIVKLENYSPVITKNT